MTVGGRWLAVLLFLSHDMLVSGDGKHVDPPYTEQQRQAEYVKRGNRWPPEIYPDNPAWKNILLQRLSQVQALTDNQMKWDGLIQTVTAALMKNYTEFGWGLTRGPEQLTHDIREAIFEGLPTAVPEGDIDVIDGPIPLFIDRPDLTARVSWLISQKVMKFDPFPLPFSCRLCLMKRCTFLAIGA